MADKPPGRFRDRAQAGRELARLLVHLKGTDPLVLGIPRGGVPVAAEVATFLGGELDVLVARKLGHPWHPEYGLGAIAPGVRVLDPSTLQALGTDARELERVEQKERRELQRRVELYRQGRPTPDVRGRVVVVVDDGVAMGVTAAAALQSVRAGHPARLVFAAPVGSRQACQALQKEADEIVLALVPEAFHAVGLWYEDFPQVEDGEVLRLLSPAQPQEVAVPTGSGSVAATLHVPRRPLGMVVFAHGSGSGRHSPRNREVAAALHGRGLATLLVDLLTPEEETVDERTRQHRFDIGLLARRLQDVLRWLPSQPALAGLGVGLFGSSTGVAAALVAASEPGLEVRAVVGRGGRPDLAGEALARVQAPTLLVVGGRDPKVLDLNRQALQALQAPKRLEVVPGATHLFEEPGALHKVADLAGDWFVRHLPRRPPRPVRKPQGPADNGPGRPLDEQALAGLVELCKDKRVVLLGEATHGTHEFYDLRARISLRLIQEHGVAFVAVEGDWPDCFRANRWAKGDPSLPGDGGVQEVLAGFTRWPTWMWANEEVAAFLARLRAHNRERPGKAGFYGLDVYSLWESLNEAMRHLRGKGEDAEAAASRALRCFEPYAEDPHKYARALAWMPEGCRGEVAGLLAAARQAAPALPDAATEARLDAQLNALVAKDAEAYYRAWAAGGPESWNVRDRHMMATLEHLLEAHGPGAKAIVWAHNTHVGDARATDMRDAGLLNLGQLARQAFPGEAFLLGFSTWQGKVVAGRAWEAPAQAMRLPAARKGSVEDWLHGAGGDRLLVGKQIPREERGHRAVGVVYHPEREQGNYVPSRLRERYDALVHVDRTQALRPLGVPVEEEELPETWPWGM